ncbi:MAG: Uma2 family endonuclease [Actinomycetota bacterium]
MATQPDAPAIEVYDELAGTPREPVRGLTYDDLQSFPDDNYQRQLIDGELIVTPAPRLRHQEVVKRLTVALAGYEVERGGKTFPGPTDVLFAPGEVAEPDVLFVTSDKLSRLGDRYIDFAPDLVVEVSSPSTRRLDTVRKLALYERFRVPEFWYVDLESERIEIHRLKGDRYDKPDIFVRGETVESPALSGFSPEVDYLLGPADD